MINQLILLYFKNAFKKFFFFRSFKVLNTTPHTTEQLSFLKDLYLQAEYDFWRDPSVLHNSVLIATDDYNALVQKLNARGLATSFVIDNLQR